MSRLVKAALVIAKSADGSDRYVYRGSPLPDGLADGEAKRLAEFLADGDEVIDPSPGLQQAPAGNASLEEWAAYAQTKGASEADLEGKSRNDLRDEFGS